MKFEHPIKQVVDEQVETQAKKGKEAALEWWQLSLIGIGSIIGAGFFLGTGISIGNAGPSIVAGYLIGGVTAYLVFAALAEMTVGDPQPGSFRTYARKAYGPWMGFMSGWIYWIAGLLIMSSEIAALSIFTRFWFPNVPLWIFAIVYSVLGFGINALGTKHFGKIESMFAVLKTATLVAFIGFGVLFATGTIVPKEVADARAYAALRPFLPNGWSGFWSSLIFVLFSYGGIEVLGLASVELKNKQDAPKAGSVAIFFLTAIYIISLLFVFYVTDWTRISGQESPFVTALSAFRFPYLDSLFNVIIVSAAFSTMVGALYAVTTVMVSLAQDGDAPQMFAQINKRGIPANSLMLSASGLAVAVGSSYFLPNTVYEYVTTAAGLLLIVNWTIILSSQVRNRAFGGKASGGYRLIGYPYTSYLGIGFIAFTITGALLHVHERIGSYVSLGIITLIAVSYRIKLERRSLSRARL